MNEDDLLRQRMRQILIQQDRMSGRGGVLVGAGANSYTDYLHRYGGQGYTRGELLAGYRNGERKPKKGTEAAIKKRLPKMFNLTLAEGKAQLKKNRKIWVNKTGGKRLTAQKKQNSTKRIFGVPKFELEKQTMAAKKKTARCIRACKIKDLGYDY